MRYSRMSLAGKFSILNIALISFIMVSFLVFLKFFFEKSVLEIVSNEYVQKFEIVSDNCTEILSDAGRISKILFTNEDIEAWFLDSGSSDYAQRLKQKMRVESHLDYLEALYPKQQFSSISIYSADGEMVNSNGIRSVSGRYQQLYEDIREYPKEPGWLDLYEKKEDGYPDGGIAYVRPYRDYSSGQIRGYILIEYKSDLLSKNFTPLRYEDAGQYLVADLEGKVKIFSDEDLGGDVSGEAFFEWAKGGGKSGSTFLYRGEKHLITASRIDRLDWMMIGVTPVSILMEQGKAMFTLVYVLGICVMAAGAVLTLCLAHSVTRPLSELAHTMKSLGKGELDVSVTVHGEDEIGMLSAEFNQMAGRIRHLIGQVYEEQQAKQKFEFAVLQAQINPHFLYNTLSSVSALIKMQKTEEAFRMIRSIGKFYRTALSNGKNLISLREEVQNVESYLQIQAVRYGEKITYRIDCDEEILDTVIVKLTLQPIVENAIYHGIKNVPHKGFIRIRGCRRGEDVLIEVKDNGIGMDPEKTGEILDTRGEGKEASFGLYNIQQRLRLYFGESYGVTVSGNYGEGTVVTVCIPCDCCLEKADSCLERKEKKENEKGADRR